MYKNGLPRNAAPLQMTLDVVIVPMGSYYKLNAFRRIYPYVVEICQSSRLTYLVVDAKIDYYPFTPAEVDKATFSVSRTKDVYLNLVRSWRP